MLVCGWRIHSALPAPCCIYISVCVCVCVCKNVFVGAELGLSSAITHISSYSVQETVRWRKCATRRDKETKRRKKKESERERESSSLRRKGDAGFLTLYAVPPSCIRFHAYICIRCAHVFLPSSVFHTCSLPSISIAVIVIDSILVLENSPSPH